MYIYKYIYVSKNLKPIFTLNSFQNFFGNGKF